MKKIDLNGKWIMMASDRKYNCDAIIPGSDFGNLIRNGIIDNPLTNYDEKRVERIASQEFSFTRTFEVSEELLNYSNAYIDVSCVDTICTCYINGQDAFSSNNAYIPVHRDIIRFLKPGRNEIVFAFKSSYKEVLRMQKEDKQLANCNGTDGITHLRKPGCHFGWDWGPFLPFTYLGDVSIGFTDREISDIRINQRTNKDISEITVSAKGADKFYIITPDGKKIDTETKVPVVEKLKVNDEDEDNHIIEKEKIVLDDVYEGSFTIEKPELWYTHDMVEREKQPLYTVVIENETEKVEKKIGLRMIRFCGSGDSSGSDFAFELNGERIFSKGASMIPMSAIPELKTQKDVDFYLDACKKSNFNMIRMWGGGEYTSDYMLEKCDEMGILIWQDYCFACNMYPLYNEEFKQNCIDEIAFNVQRMAIHPCMAIFCGNNEIEQMFFYLTSSSKFYRSYIDFFKNTLPYLTIQYGQIPYISTSPLGSYPFRGTADDNVGDVHKWSVWHGLQAAEFTLKSLPRFVSEFGMQSLPSNRSVAQFAKTPESRSLHSKEFDIHQKCVGGNDKMLFYLRKKYAEPKNFDDFPYLTGLIQSSCIQVATEHYRRHKGVCNGSLFWQLNDVWDCPSWSSIDFQNVQKPMMFKARDFFAAITLSYNGKNVYYHNDTLEDITIELLIRIYNKDKVVKEDRVRFDARSQSTDKCASIKLQKGDVLRLDFNDRTLVYKNEPKLQPSDVQIVKEENKLYLKADTFTSDVWIECSSQMSDNDFDLFPGEIKIVEFDGPIDDLTIRCLNNVEFLKKGVSSKIKQIKTFLKPINVSNYFYYRNK